MRKLRPPQTTLTEHEIHTRIVGRLRLAHVAFFHLYNPGRMTPYARNRAKALGATSPKGSPLLGGTGVPDLMIATPPPCGDYVGAALELKVASGTVRPAQKVWLEHLHAAGWATATAYGEAEAVEVLRGWGYLVIRAL